MDLKTKLHLLFIKINGNELDPDFLSYMQKYTGQIEGDSQRQDGGKRHVGGKKGC